MSPLPKVPSGPFIQELAEALLRAFDSLNESQKEVVRSTMKGKP